MKFAKRYTAKRDILVGRGRENGEPSPYSWVLYTELKKEIKRLDRDQCLQRQNIEANDDCPVCMERFETGADAITTKCGHKMHAFCLIDTVTAVNQACPLCRKPLNELIPGGVDGDQLRFGAQIRISMDSVQSCHNQVFADIESKKGEIEASNTRRGGGRGGTVANSRASSRGEADIEALIVKLTMVLDYERLTCEALRKITKKFDKVAGSHMCKEVMERLWKSGFFQDSCEGGNGRAEALHESLQELFESMRRQAAEGAAEVSGSPKKKTNMKQVAGLVKWLQKKLTVGSGEGAAAGAGAGTGAGEKQGDDDMRVGSSSPTRKSPRRNSSFEKMTDQMCTPRSLGDDPTDLVTDEGQFRLLKQIPAPVRSKRSAKAAVVL